MSIASNKQRITITVSKEMAERLEMYSQKMGVTKSSMCAQFVGQSIMAFDKTYEAFDSMVNNVLVEEVKGVKGE